MAAPGLNKTDRMETGELVARKWRMPVGVSICKCGRVIRDEKKICGRCFKSPTAENIRAA